MTHNSHMVHLETDAAVFNLRIVCVFLHGDYVLIHRAEPDDFWTAPGGRVELGESTREAAAREMREELKVDVEVARLLWVVEYFLEAQGRSFHEVAFYYHAHFPPAYNITPDIPLFHGDDFGMPLIFRWARVDELEELRFYPSFLKTALRELPETAQHVILREDD